MSDAQVAYQFVDDQVKFLCFFEADDKDACRSIAN